MKTFYTKRRHLLFIFCALILITSLVIAHAAFNRTDAESYTYQDVAKINDIPVALGELQMFVNDARQTTASYFKNKYGAEDISGDNWKKYFGEEAPVDYAINLAINELTRYKIVQQKCVEYGILNDISYKTFVEKLEKENTERKEKIQNGVNISGPTEYTQSVYYDYLQDRYETELKTVMVIEYNDDDLMKVYSENEDEFYNFGSVTMKSLILPQIEFSQKTVKEIRIDLIQLTNQDYDFESAVNMIGVTDYLEIRTFTEGDIGIEGGEGQHKIESTLYSLEVDSISEIIPNSTDWILLYCECREGNGKIPFEECREDLIEIYRENYYEDQIKQAEQSAEIVVYGKAKEYIN